MRPFGRECGHKRRTVMNRMFVAASLFLALIACMLSGGCATIVNGKTQEILIASNPPGAIATVDSGEMCTTPGKVTLRRNKDYVVTITKEGYQPQVVSLNSVLSGWL